MSGLLLLGAMGLGMLAWYYSSALGRAHVAHGTVRPGGGVSADADSTLPPLGHVERAATPPTATGQTGKAESAPNYRIGSVLDDPVSPGSLLPEIGHVISDASPAKQPQKSAKEQLQERLLGGAVFARPSAPEIDSPAPRAVSAEDSLVDRSAVAGGSSHSASALSSLLSVDTPAIARATVLQTQRLLLPKGSFLDCTLETAIDSTLPGLVTCLTAVDTFGADGSVVLLERGTKLIGETRGEVAQGASRIFVLWSEARTPEGVVVPLASPGTDELGRSGLAGTVNRHFWERFGAAILVSMIDGAIQGATAHQTNGGGTVVVSPTGTRDVTTEVLRSTINIPPTVIKQQGDRIQVLVARDLDFRSVYALRAR